MAFGLSTLTPTRQKQPLFFETASLNGSSSPVASNLNSSPVHQRASPQKYTFTPQRVKALPRAWERRPATPYVARNEAQKIWKRVPLGSLSANNGDHWNKANHQTMTRPVKKLRVMQTEEEIDKENIRYVASKWDEDRISSTSPRRKLSGFTAINRAQPMGINEGISQDIENRKRTEGGMSVEEMGEDESDDVGGALAISADEQDPEEDLPKADCSVDEAVRDVCLDQVPDSISEEELATGAGPLALETLGHMGTACLAKNNCLPPPESPDALYSTSATNDGQQPTLVCLTQTGASLPLTEASNDAAADFDDTAFLHDFLSRARAQKAARQLPEPDTVPQGDQTANPAPAHLVMETAVQKSPLKSPTAPLAEPTDPLRLDDAPLEPDAQADVAQSSPCRRSSRLFTRLPRPQKQSTNLPNNIALKRLNGSEFISQKETQSVALMTRTNTKRNRGPAKPVLERLIQLDAEAKARKPDTDLEGKKRRRQAKEVTWATELARYSDGTTISSSVGGSDLSTTESDVSTDRTNDESETSTQPEPCGDVVEEDKKQVRKVRKLRKLNIGSVNGTPAPKKTTNLPVPIVSPFAIDNCNPFGTVLSEANRIAHGPQTGSEVEQDTKHVGSDNGSARLGQGRLRTRRTTR